MLRLLAPLALLIGVVALVLAGDRPLPRADFTFITRADATTLDPAKMSWLQDLVVGKMILEGLTTHDIFSPEFTVKPGAAERWDLSEDKRIYTFHLRADARWSNGEPLKASDFIYAWRRVLLPDTAADFTGFLQGIRGAREFFQWRQKQTAEFAAGKSSAKDAQELWRQAAARFDETVGVHAPDDRTLVVELENPIPYFPDLCAFPSLFPVYPPVVSQYEQPDPRTGLIRSRSDWTKPPRLVTNGPMKLAVWRFKRDMRFEKNEWYWGRDAVAVDSINMPSIADQNAQVLAFQTGAVDVVVDASARYRSEIVADKQRFYAEHKEEYERLKADGWDQFDIDRRLPKDPRKNVQVVPMFGTYFYNFNCRPRLADGRVNPFADARVRRAFSMAVDRRVLTGEVLRMGNRPAYTLIPPGSIAGYESPKACIYDPAAARRLLADAGYPSGKSFPITVDILFNKEGEHDRIAQFVAKEWERNLGVSVSLTPKEIRVFRDDLKKGNFITSRAGWYGDYGDPTSFLDTSRSWDGNNDRKFNSPEYDELLRRAAAEPDAAARLKILSEAERRLMEVEQPMMPLYQQATMYLMDVDRISGLSDHPRTVLLLGGVDVLGDGKGSERAKGMPPKATARLRDAQELARQHPDTFGVPSDKELAQLAPGMMVKVSDGSERFWVLLESVSADRLVGVIDNDLDGSGGHGLTAGARIELERRHVYDIDLPTGPEGH